jgi:hypothetical protein
MTTTLLEKALGDGPVKIIHGANDDIFNIVGARIEVVRTNLADAFNLPVGVLAFVNGNEVADDFRLRANDTLEFIFRWGRKGAGPAYTSISGNNSDLMVKVAGLYFKDGDRIADVTFGNGVFWRKIDRSAFQFFPSDIITCPKTAFDFRDLPYPNDAFNVHVFDPPYKHNPARTSSAESSYRNFQTTGGMSHSAIIDLYRQGMREGLRILKDGGMMLVKCQDEIESGKQRLSHIEIWEIATQELGMVVQDLFVLTPKTTPIIEYRNQKHARKNHSYLWVFRKRCSGVRSGSRQR